MTYILIAYLAYKVGVGSWWLYTICGLCMSWKLVFTVGKVIGIASEED